LDEFVPWKERSEWNLVDWALVEFQKQVVGAWILANERATARNALFESVNRADEEAPCQALAL
jgi:hypothetical protein